VNRAADAWPFSTSTVGVKSGSTWCNINPLNQYRCGELVPLPSFTASGIRHWVSTARPCLKSWSVLAAAYPNARGSACVSNVSTTWHGQQGTFDITHLTGEARLLFDHAAAQTHVGGSVFWLRRFTVPDDEHTTTPHWQITCDRSYRGIVEILLESL
jgi:hypothetical protein